MNYWLVKSEPDAYSWTQLTKDGKTAWTGVRNYQARIHLRSMKQGDPVFFYHSGGEKRVVGLARVTREAYPDATATEGEWVCVDLEAVKSLKSAVPLSVIKAENSLREIKLIKHSRLSVLPLTPEEFRKVSKLAGEA